MDSEFTIGILVGIGLTVYMFTVFHGMLCAKWRPSELLFFPDERSTGARRFSNQNRIYRPIRDPNSSLLKIMDTLKGAKRSICICMYRFTLRQFAELLEAMHMRGNARIRIITDNGPEPVESNQIPRLKQAGIEVREKDTPEDDKFRPLMHNKFVIVDNTSCLIGSFNWTLAAATRHHEVVIKSYEPHILKELKQKFEQMWRDLE